MLPVGDYPNPRTPQWVTRLLVASNVAIYLFVTLPLEQNLGVDRLRDPAVLRQVDGMWEAQKGAVADRYREAYELGKIPLIPPEDV